MRRLTLLALLVLVPLRARAEPEPLVEQVRSAIDRGVRYLRRAEGGRGDWEVGNFALLFPGGMTSMALLALMNCGVPPDDPVVKRGLTYLRTVEPRHVYVTGLQTMVFAEASDVADRGRIQRNVDWLIKARIMSEGRLGGWSYGDQDGTPDNSNTQYALLGLNAGRQAGATVDRAVWESIRDFYRLTQSQASGEEGGWGYHPDRDRVRGGRANRLTMTIAGICGLQIVGLELNKGQQQLDPATGVAAACGRYLENDALRAALRWLEGSAPDRSTRFRYANEYTYYNVYGIERAGRLTGQRFLASRDWYREGCEYLVGIQSENDAWSGKIFPDVVSTSFALLFLSKGRTPVLVSKFAYGAGDSGGWNNKHFDAKHLVEFASRELFKKQPLAWQAYDARKLPGLNRQERAREVGNLLQSPIVYMNGHDAPVLRQQQKDILKQYLEEGGFLLAEACCGRDGFADGFRRLMAEMYPDNPLKPLSPDHAVWRAWKVVPPDFAQLEGIEMGCKTVVVFSPTPLAGYWEENLSTEGRGALAFRLAGNVITYATGLQPPNARLTETVLADNRPERDVPRGFLQVAQLRHEGDWQPAPRAMRNLMRHLRETQKIDVNLRTEEMAFANPDLFKHKFLYLHGRGRFAVAAEGLDNLRANLTTGGTLLADACCGSPAFDAAFREFAAQLFPNAKLEPIPIGDELYSAELNGARIDTVKVRTGTGGFDAQPPALEGIKVGEGKGARWAVIYSRYDLGCALEKHASGDCKGHDHESALKLAGAAVLYMYKK